MCKPESLVAEKRNMYENLPQSFDAEVIMSVRKAFTKVVEHIHNTMELMRYFNKDEMDCKEVSHLYNDTFITIDAIQQLQKWIETKKQLEELTDNINFIQIQQNLDYKLDRMFH